MIELNKELNPKEKKKINLMDVINYQVEVNLK